MKKLFILALLGLNNLFGRKPVKGEPIITSITTVNPDNMVDDQQWKHELNVGRSYAGFSPYDKGETIEEMQKMHKEEVIKNAQKNQELNYQLRDFNSKLEFVL